MLQSSSLCLRESQGVSNISFQMEDIASESMTPFERIKKIAGDTALMEKLLKVVNNKFLYDAESTQFLPSSCSVNFNFLNICFIGEERAMEIQKPFSTSVSLPVSILMYNNSNKLETNKVLFHHILSPYAVLEQNKRLQDPSYKFSQKSLEHFINNSPDFQQPLKIFKDNIEKMYLAKKFGPSILEYNHPIIDALQSEMNENGSKVCENCSFIYHVVIDVPDPVIAKKGTQKEVMNSLIQCGHAFILEQYYCPKDNIDKVRLHQAWKDKLTLEKYYEKMGNGSIEGIFDSGKLKSFFHNLKGFLSSGRNSKYADPAQSQFLCFGIEENVMELGNFFRPGAGIFTGPSLRYITSKIDPNECNRHMDEFIKKYG